MTTDPSPRRRGAHRAGRASGGLRGSWAALVVAAVARALLALVTGLLLWSVAPAALGWESTVVLSGSMEPRLHTGDVVVVRPGAVAELVPGRVLLVDHPERQGQLLLHRLHDVDDAGRLWLKGDANAEPDTSPVEAARVHGIASLRVPWAGAVVVWAQEGRWAPVLAAGAAVAGLLPAATWFRLPAAPASPPQRDHVRRARWRLRLLGLGAGALTVLTVLTVLDLTGAGAALASTTSNAGDAWGSGTYYTCANAARDVGAGGITGTSVAQRYYGLQETSGSTAYDTAGTPQNATYTAAGTYLGRAGGPCPRDGGRAVYLDGTYGYVYTTDAIANPTVFTLSIWFRTSTGYGGVLMDLARDPVGDSIYHDRLLYMSYSGNLYFGLRPGTTPRTIRTPLPYNDNRWHLATVTVSAAGSYLYVDGARVAGDATMTTPRNYTGYWRLGYDDISDAWPDNTYGGHWRGYLAHASVYTRELTAGQIADHYRAGV
ncbi:signal peptidase I [Blastococcus montanus]|uniref:signal peptidase I n=1 Tax=Blastococcus montanus TaxID=3144973 RepID=UPI00320806D8